MDARLAFLSRRKQSAAAFGLYLLLSSLWLGVQLAIHREGRTYFGIKVDPQIFIWAFGWWPHAIVHGENPIVTHQIWAPDGFDLAWTGTAPGLAVIFAPLTLLVGPLASFNVAWVLMPPLAAWTAFLLCRYLTRAFWPSLLGGYLFGFSSYELGQLKGHLFLTAVFLIPLIALVTLRYLDGGLSGRGLALRFAPLLALELTFSIEVAFTATLALAVALVLAFLLVPERRRRIAAAVPWVVVGYVLAAAIVAPLTYYWLTDFKHGRVNPASPETFTLDWLNFVAPTPVTGFGHWWTESIDKRFHAGHAESGSYLGVPMLIILGWFAWQRRRTAAGRFLPVALLATAVAASGTWLRVGGHELVTMPWEHVEYLPVFNNVLPARLSLYIALITAVTVALWAASTLVPVRTRVALAALTVFFVAPSFAGSWTTSINEPAFIADGTYKSCIRKNENVAIFPFSRHGDSMLWQADAGYWFRQTGGYVAPRPPASFLSDPDIADISSFGTHSEEVVGPLLELVRVKHVDVVLVEESRAEPWRSLLRGVATPKRVGGVLLYRFRGTTPAACVA